MYIFVILENLIKKINYTTNSNGLKNSFFILQNGKHICLLCNESTPVMKVSLTGQIRISNFTDRTKKKRQHPEAYCNFDKVAANVS